MTTSADAPTKVEGQERQRENGALRINTVCWWRPLLFWAAIGWRRIKRVHWNWSDWKWWLPTTFELNPDIWESLQIAPLHLELLERQQKGTTRVWSRGSGCVRFWISRRCCPIKSHRNQLEAGWKLECGGLGGGGEGGLDFVVGGASRSFGRELGGESEPDVWLRTLTTFPPPTTYNLRHPASLKRCWRGRCWRLHNADVSVKTKTSGKQYCAKSI